MEQFELNAHDYIELNNLLKVTGLCESGGIAKMLIADGQVKVDGVVELRKRCKIRKGQIVSYNNYQVQVN
ncbi:MAG: RNA-binding S4 domain-containing protein [Gammaproteobacteria bacterium]|nr:RNA-binding S4 domain-containing protein [Gammaproteobacteria bacterium]